MKTYKEIVEEAVHAIAGMPVLHERRRDIAFEVVLRALLQERREEKMDDE